MFIAPRTLRGLQDLHDMLVALGLEVERRGHTLVVRPGRAGPPLVVEWLRGYGLVRVIAPVLSEVHETRLAAVMALVLRINARLYVPGFVLDADRSRLVYRSVVLLDGAEQASSEVIGAALTSAVRVMERYAAELRRAARAPAATEPQPEWAREASC